MMDPLDAEFGGDNSHYWDHVAESLGWDAYGRYEVWADDYSDVNHLLNMGAPIRVAAALDTHAAPKSYICKRCGVERRKRADSPPVEGMCADCVAVERGADRPPTIAMEQADARSRSRQQTISAASQNNQTARHREARRLRQQREQYAQQLKEAKKPRAKHPVSRPRKPQQEHLSPREAASAKQSEQERQFLQDLQDSGAEWLLKARHK